MKKLVASIFYGLIFSLFMSLHPQCVNNMAVAEMAFTSGGVVSGIYYAFYVD
jgi:hypothetical protein